MLRVQVQTQGQGELTLLDMNGRTVLETAVQNEMTRLDLTLLPAGSYLLQYRNGSSVVHRQIQVVR